jgi:hypothetical protein
MCNNLSKPVPKTLSLVFKFLDALHTDDTAFGAPEPNYLKWVDKQLCADLGTASDTAAHDKLSVEERAAWKVFHNALDATDNLMKLYQQNGTLFRKVAREMSFLPCLLSWHPDAERANRQLLAFSELGRKSMYGELRQNPKHAAHQPWPVRYAYAIVATIDLTLDCYEDVLPLWSKLYGGDPEAALSPEQLEAALATTAGSKKTLKRVRFLGMRGKRFLPAWALGLDTLPRPFNQEHMLAYWDKGKEMILEELPEFHLRPEWADYHSERRYAGGAKKGAIQHAIFKDILAALRTIAGANKRPRRKPRVKREK